MGFYIRGGIGPVRFSHRLGGSRRGSNQRPMRTYDGPAFDRRLHRRDFVALGIATGVILLGVVAVVIVAVSG